MQAIRATGRNAAVMKYDVLTALGAHGCGGDKHMQRLVLRFITLIVARYNWQADELAVGQREIAALWSVDERTVKRDLARLRERGWMVVKRPAARGRVAVHRIDLGAIMAATAADFGRVGPDFVARMTAGGPAPDQPGQAGNVITFPAPTATRGEGEAALWPRAQEALHRRNPALFAAWFAALTQEPGPQGRLSLRAPTRFHAAFVATHHLAALEAAARAVDPAIEGVDVSG